MQAETGPRSEGNRVFSSLAKEDLDRLLRSFIEVELLKDSKGLDTFSLIRETLSRIGIRKRDKLFQTAHILHKKGRYYIVHFKQLFMLDGDVSTSFTLDEEDEMRLRKIISLLEKWGMLKVLDFDRFAQTQEKHISTFVNVVSHEDVKNGVVQLIKKYDL